MRSEKHDRGAVRLLILLGLSTLLWTALTGAAHDAWILGIPAVLGFSALLVRKEPFQVPRINPLALLRFIGYFSIESWRGGLRVSITALSPSLPLSPEIVSYTTRLPAGAPRVAFINAISLLPGTLTMHQDGAKLHIHLLQATDITTSLGLLEERISAVFGVRLEALQT